MEWLNETQIENKLAVDPTLRTFWESPAPLLIVRKAPTKEDPVYEIQLVWDLGDRLETFRWLWIDAWQGEILKQFPD